MDLFIVTLAVRCCLAVVFKSIYVPGQTKYLCSSMLCYNIQKQMVLFLQNAGYSNAC